MRIPWMTIRRVMILVAIIAVDIACLRRGVDVNLAVAIPLLQIGVFRLVSSTGRIRPFWVGFEMAGWAGVIPFLLGLGQPWFSFLDEQLNNAVSRIEQTSPGVAKAAAMALICEGTPIKDTLPGLLPESLVAGMPIILLALIGGLLAAWQSPRLDGLHPCSSGADELESCPAIRRENAAGLDRRGKTRREDRRLPGVERIHEVTNGSAGEPNRGQGSKSLAALPFRFLSNRIVPAHGHDPGGCQFGGLPGQLLLKALER